MNLILYGRLGWTWTHSGTTWHTDKDGKGLYCGRMLMDSEFNAPRSRRDMTRFLAKGELQNGQWN